jgi:hypothetical protein
MYEYANLSPRPSAAAPVISSGPHGNAMESLELVIIAAVPTRSCSKYRDVTAPSLS